MQAARIARLLPGTYQAAFRPDNALGAMLAAMEALHGPAEARLDALDDQVDPHRADDAFAYMLADWLGLGRYLDWSGGRPGAGSPRFAPGLGRLRLLTAEAARLARARGSRDALVRFLEVATGAPGFSVAEGPPDETGAPQPFHLIVTAPAAAARYAELVGRIVEAERPAYATYAIAYAPA